MQKKTNQILENRVRKIYKQILNEETTDPIRSQIYSIIKSVTGNRDFESKRIKALEDAGFIVTYEGVKWNFGTVGDSRVLEPGKKYLFQLMYAQGVRAKNGYRGNKCDVYIIEKQ